MAAAWGCDLERFESADQVAQWTGIAPITKQSGRTRVVFKRIACPKFLRQTVHEFARCSIPRSAWAGAYYRMLRARGQRQNSALRSLAFKWIDVLLRCWKDRKNYDEQKYLQRLTQKHSPLPAYLEPEKTLPNP